MELKYYVLGKKDNETIKSYRDKYYLYLLKIAEEIKDKISDEMSSFLTDPSNKSFLLSPDVSSILNELKRSQSDADKYCELLNNIRNFEFEKIEGTNVALTLDDFNPYNTIDIHPDHIKEGIGLGRGSVAKEDWFSTFKNVFEIMKQADEGMYEEINFLLQKIVPFSTHEKIHNSASYKECIGTIYLGYIINKHPEASIIEGLIHEYSHNKLNLIMQCENIILNDKQEIYYSAYRPDARHIHGIYIGLHAFAPTINILIKAFKRGLFTEQFLLEKLLLYHLKNKYSYIVLKKYGIFSALGTDILNEMVYVNKLTENEIQSMNISENLNSIVKEKFKTHLKDVIKNYPGLQY